MEILLIIAAIFATANCQSGNSPTTRYWDCCKPTCSWNGKGPFSSPVRSCAKDGNTPVNAGMKSGCGGGGSPGAAYACTNNAPWVISGSEAHGFMAAKFPGFGEKELCCACMELTFTSGPVKGQKFVAQITNTGNDPGTERGNHIDILIPGGGVGQNNGCSPQWGGGFNFGASHGGVNSAAGCNGLPKQLQSGCQWRFGWFKGADNPTVSFRRVKCPKDITDRSGCIRNDENSIGSQKQGKMHTVSRLQKSGKSHAISNVHHKSNTHGKQNH